MMLSASFPIQEARKCVVIPASINWAPSEKGMGTREGCGDTEASSHTLAVPAQGWRGLCGLGFVLFFFFFVLLAPAPAAFSASNFSSLCS